MQYCDFPVHRLSDIDDLGCSSEKVCWISETSDLLPITDFLLMPFFMLTKGGVEMENGNNLKFWPHVPFLTILLLATLFA